MNKIDLKNLEFGRLTVVREVGKDKAGSLIWECKCRCGKLIKTRGYCLTRGMTLSCGCLRGGQLVGRIFGKLTVQTFSHSRASTYSEKYWKCLCDCGNMTTVSTNKLRTGHTKSCGCLRKSVAVSDEESAFFRVYMSYQRNAEKLGRVFELTRKQFRDLTSQDCHYCGRGPSSIRKGRRGSQNYTYNGLDRINNKEGYTINNVVTCCRRDNRLKSDMFTQKETRVMVEALERLHKNEPK